MAELSVAARLILIRYFLHAPIHFDSTVLLAVDFLPTMTTTDFMVPV
jgi:hypothetical protein